MTDNIGYLIDALREKPKLRTIGIAPNVKEFLDNDDVLSQELTVFKYRGTVNGDEAEYFIELTDELIDILNYMYADTESEQ